MGNDWLQILLIILLFLILVKPMGTYLYWVFSHDKQKMDRFFLPVENLVYRLAGIRDLSGMTWKQYGLSLLWTNAILMGFAYLVLRLQGGLPLNPGRIASMEPTLAFNTVASFMTNTDIQHYSGETSLSILSQMIVILTMMFTSAATGLSVAIAFIRGLATKGETLGNFYQDFVRAHFRLLLPLSVVVTLLLVLLGVPQTLDAHVTATTLEGHKQVIALGPVAALESIKQLGTNGGGFFGANSAHPFENPNPLSCVVEILSMWCIPAALPYTYGLMVGNRKQGWVIFSVMMAMFVVFLVSDYLAEMYGNPALNKLGFSSAQGNMEGKEVRFGIPLSSIFTTVTTAIMDGAVNNMHDSLTPLGGLVPLAQMMLNAVFGGEGVGFVNILMYAILAVFLSGLMVGRTPEFLGRKIESKEMKLIVVALLAHPLIILLPAAIAFLTPDGMGSISNPGFHGISQVLYEYTSAAANNGSEFGGLNGNTPFWNITDGIVMLLGRYVSMFALLAVAGSLVQKQPAPETAGSFRTDNATFGAVLLGTVLIIGALTFFPVLVLGPVAEFLLIR